MLHTINTSLYYKQQPFQRNIIFPTRIILHPRIDVVGITDVQDTPKNVCKRVQAKKSMQRHTIFLIYVDYDYILDKIELGEKIDF